jgi:HD-like signal output (HDOD) protein
MANLTTFLVQLHFNPTDNRNWSIRELHPQPSHAFNQEAMDDPIAKILAKVGDIAVLPQVVCQVVEATGSEDASVKRLEQTILIDPGLSAMLLTQANSAYFALPKKVTSIREAVMFLGFKGVRQIAMAVGVFDLFLGKTDGDSLRRRTWWKLSLETAVVCRGMADFIQDVNPDEAYTCGLLHLIGKTILDRFDQDQYQRVQQVVDQGAPDVLAERAVFGCDHITIATAASEKWGFPELLIKGLNYFTPAQEHTRENALRATTALGVRVIKLNAQGKSADEFDEESVPHWILDALSVTDNELRALVRAGLDSLEASASFTI